MVLALTFEYACIPISFCQIALFNLKHLKFQCCERRKKLQLLNQPVLPERSPETALPYDADPVCELAAPRAFFIWRILKKSRGCGWLWTVVVSSSSCPISFLFKDCLSLDCLREEPLGVGCDLFDPEMPLVLRAAPVGIGVG